MPKTNKLTPMQALQQIGNIVWRFDYSYILPRPDMLSMLYYILVVYPLLYVFVWRMCIQPLVEVFQVSFSWIKYVSSVYNYAGAMPKSIP